MTVFLGFLPARTLENRILADQTLRAAFAWGIIALGSPWPIIHYPIIFAALCLIAWRQFRREEPLAGKMWLSLASGLGISIGVMLILAITPGVYPTAATDTVQGLFLANVYLGGAVIGMAHVCGTLLEARVGRAVIRGYVSLLFLLVVARSLVLIAWLVDAAALFRGQLVWKATGTPLVVLTLALLLLVTPVLTLLVRRSVRAGSDAQARWFLLGLALAAFVGELLARGLGI